MPSDDLLHIDELARLGGVTRRTVRFYVQRGLLPGPEGLGRGAMYRREHLHRLRRVRDLQAAGVPLAEIARMLDRSAPAPVAPARPRPVALSRFAVAPGVALEVETGALPAHAAAELAARLAELVAVADKAGIPNPEPDQ
jgi:DNA-binding transcriptional MerR regulator